MTLKLTLAISRKPLNGTERIFLAACCAIERIAPGGAGGYFSNSA